MSLCGWQEGVSALYRFAYLGYMWHVHFHISSKMHVTSKKFDWSFFILFISWWRVKQHVQNNCIFRAIKTFKSKLPEMCFMAYMRANTLSFCQPHEDF